MLQLDQFISFKNEAEKEGAIAWLQSRGYENVGGLTVKNYRFPVLIVRGGCFFGTNTTCMAAGRQKTIFWKEWLKNR